MKRFQTTLLRPEKPEGDDSWAFVVLPKKVSGGLPRRGRTTVDGTLNGHPFRATLEPDGKLSHWLKIDREIQEFVGVKVGETVTMEIMPVEKEPEPDVPSDFAAALAAAPEARKVWDGTTTIARLDWIHWITTAKQSRTRAKRISDACDMLASGKKRVCCFDPSGYYSKAFSAPEAAD
ncbi:MAG: YdeI/OmpD-associated family protein [Luteolibacter sp.]